MSPLLRYILLQVPGALFLGGLLLAGWSRGWLSAGAAALILLIWALKDALLYPFYRPALQGAMPTGGQALVGAEAVARTEIRSGGQVLVRGERWQARSADGTRIPPGSRVRIVAASGLRLKVRPLDGGERD